MAEKQVERMKIPDEGDNKFLLISEIVAIAIAIGVPIATISDVGSVSAVFENMKFSLLIPFLFGFGHAVYVFKAGMLVKAVYPKWRGYAIGTIIALLLGLAIGEVGCIVNRFGLTFAGFAIICAAALLLCVYHFKTNLGKRYALTFNQMLDAGYFDELERRKKAGVERETAVIIETAESATGQMRVPGKKVERVKPAAPFTGKGPAAQPKAATPPKPATSTERKPEGGEERPTGHRLKL